MPHPARHRPRRKPILPTAANDQVTLRPLLGPSIPTRPAPASSQQLVRPPSPATAQRIPARLLQRFTNAWCSLTAPTGNAFLPSDSFACYRTCSDLSLPPISARSLTSATLFSKHNGMPSALGQTWSPFQILRPIRPLPQDARALPPQRQAAPRTVCRQLDHARSHLYMAYTNTLLAARSLR
ncbi:hypothetical protein CERSUDRAFT_93952 [Gelatoporia subvermispora B]|uniref:Uncharacterized protein n=1 Tax=Ceriporiopsis subvermispora (strain B) TaxID=914234 RepID=M2QN35_CERS8|nr:hypothetical protein CERSUDRAFT_93952 [Gelatoporia subvermispora B]